MDTGNKLDCLVSRLFGVGPNTKGVIMVVFYGVAIAVLILITGEYILHKEKSAETCKQLIYGYRSI